MPESIKVVLVTNQDGAHLDSYYAALAATREADGVALVDPSGSKVDAARKVLGPKLQATFKDAADAYAKFQPTMALVSLESGLSPAAIDQALEANCHVMAEKPACLRAVDFEKLTRKAEQKHRHLMLALANRLHSPVQEARRMVQKGVIGKVYSVNLHLVADQTRITREAYRKSWFATKARAGGGHFLWLGIHWLDLALFITGLKVTEVAGFAGVVGGQPIDVEDSAAVALKFNNQTFGTMTSGYYLDKGYHSFLQVWGEHGWLRINTFEEKPMEWYTTKDEKMPIIREFKYAPGSRGYTPWVRACVRASAGLEPAPITGEECLHLLKTIYTFYQAAESGRALKV